MSTCIIVVGEEILISVIVKVSPKCSSVVCDKCGDGSVGFFDKNDEVNLLSALTLY